MAERAVQRAPKVGSYRNTLGVARYRAGDNTGALEALDQSMELGSGGNAYDWLFLAMAHRQLEDETSARAWYDKAVAWMEKHKPDDEELKRYRAEAEEVLGLSSSRGSEDEGQ